MKTAVASSSSRVLAAVGASFSALLLVAACSSSEENEGDASVADSGAAADASVVVDARDATTSDADAAASDAGAGSGADAHVPGGGDAAASDSGDAAITAPDGGNDSGAAASFPDVHFYGRMDWRDVAGPRFDWSGSSVAASFTGTGIAVRLGNVDTGSGPNRMQAVIDGTPSDEYTLLDDSADETYTLASGLADGPHTVQLYKRTEGYYGAVQFLGFVTEDSTNDTDWALTPSTEPTRHIEIIGDSISAGYGVLSPSISCSGVDYLNYEDAYLAYGLDTARTFGAAAVSIAWSGKGVYRDYNGNTANNVPFYYPFTLATDTLAYDFSQQVDVVLIDLGTNDFAQGDPGQENFEGAYVALATTVRSHYPNAYILLLTGPMVNSTFPFQGALALLKQYVDDVVSTRQAAGDTNIADLYLAAQDCGNEQCGCDSHPDVDRQQTMSNTIVKRLQKVLGW
jgi:lysophospholipase L1-like esterase